VWRLIEEDKQINLTQHMSKLKTHFQTQFPMKITMPPAKEIRKVNLKLRSMRLTKDIQRANEGIRLFAN
jgi:hypothetical protein